MQAVFEVLAPIGGLFLGSVLVAWVLAQAASSLARPMPAPREGAPIRLRTRSGSYRCRFERRRRSVWWCTAPLHEGTQVPLRVGEVVYVEAPLPCGVLRFKTSIVGRCIETHLLQLGSPQRWVETERRKERRDRSVAGSLVKINGHSSQLVDASNNGAQVITTALVSLGDRVRFERPGEKARDAFILATSPEALGKRIGVRAHLLLT